jgi:hypothetical protein
MTALAHVHSDPESIRAALYRPCPPGIALDIWLDALADEHDEPAATPPHNEAPEVMHMAKTCSREGCTNPLGPANKSGVCSPCQQGRTAHLSGAVPKPPRKRKDADDAVLARAGLAETIDKAPADSAALAAPTPDETWLAKFYRLHEALGLDADGAIEEHCRSWVEAVTSRALGQAAAKPVRLHARHAEQPADAAVGTGG